MKAERKSKPRALAIEKQTHTESLIRVALGFGLVLLALFLALTQVRAAETTRILAYGDSLSAGYRLPPDAGFTDQLQAALDEAGLNVEVINAAVSGDTTANGLARLDWSTPEDIDLVLLELGANDALRGQPVERAKSNLASMIEKFQDKGAKVALLGMRAPPNLGKEYVEAFDAIYPALAEQYDIPLYPFFLEDVAGQPKLNLDDGIHPTEEGVAIIVKNVAPFVKDIVETLN
ncbi:acyl-CoA thioesterase-1 [Cohaesibacter sp. ES.047]|uniref:arylesterase n=1 Tax=Cohaesibacter sp. ES.047 TaxID=1798205 RepID=UPI000BB79B90|nr:arylesterase [Cohaesibacter sp. ES.047]SNY90593.1 acyl-CoA thioesterase-1 [Cohaesibacter sp. ES.047]